MNPTVLTNAEVQAQADVVKDSGVEVEEVIYKEREIKEDKNGIAKQKETKQKQIKQKETKQKETKPETETNEEPMEEEKDDTADTTETTEAQPKKTPRPRSDKYYVHAFKVLVNKFFQGGNLGELKLDGVPHDALLSSGFYRDRNFHARKSPQVGTTLYRSYHPTKMVEILKKHDGASGKYRLLKPSEVPSQTDLQLELASSQRILNAAIKQQELTEQNKLTAKKTSALVSSPAGRFAGQAQKRKMLPPIQNANTGPAFNKKMKNQGQQSYQNFNQPQKQFGQMRGGKNQGRQYNNQSFQQRGWQNNYQGFQKQGRNYNQGFQRQGQNMNYQNYQNYQGFNNPQGGGWSSFKKPNQGQNFQGQNKGNRGGFQQSNYNPYVNQMNEAYNEMDADFGYEEPTMDYQESEDLYYDFTDDSPQVNKGYQQQGRNQNQGFKFQNQGIQQTNQGIRSPSQGIRPPNQGIRSPSQGIRSPNQGIRPPNQGIRPPNQGIRPPTFKQKQQKKQIKEENQGYNLMNEFEQNYQEYEQNQGCSDKFQSNAGGFSNFDSQRQSTGKSSGWNETKVGPLRQTDFTKTGFQQYPSDNNYY